MHVSSTPRTLLIAAHPDDETIGAAVRISRSREVEIVHVTDGAPANPSDALAAGFSSARDYAAARRKETECALAKAGVLPSSIQNLGFMDQQLSFYLEELTSRLVTLFDELQPHVVLTHAYEGGHPDHDSVAFACSLAKELHERSNPAWSFDLVEFTGYHAADGGIRTYEFLPNVVETAPSSPLSAPERELKVSMLREFKSQARTLAPFMDPEFELFRKAPAYDFSQPPHAGTLFYEHFEWGVNGREWRNLASDALAGLLNPITDRS